MEHVKEITIEIGPAFREAIRECANGLKPHIAQLSALTKAAGRDPRNDWYRIVGQLSKELVRKAPVDMRNNTNETAAVFAALSIIEAGAPEGEVMEVLAYVLGPEADQREKAAGVTPN